MEIDGDASRAARPFLKWAGGKRQLLPELLRRMPREFGTYYEPFIGGGALFFEAAPARAVLADRNPRLVRTWRAIQNDVDRVIELLRTYPIDEDFFYAFREKAIDAALEDAEVAAWMIYLNKTGFNGLYRVNKKRGTFNVPWGRYKNPNTCDEPNLRAVSTRLQGVQILLQDFEAIRDLPAAGDFVYFDPPYEPLSPSSNFTAYTAHGFGPAEQERLRDLALALKSRGVHVLLSNSSAPLILDLYRDGFEVELVQASRSINSVGEGRGKIAEVLAR